MNKPPLPDKTKALIKNLVKFISDTDKAHQIKTTEELLKREENYIDNH